jgi:hypothetical protein
MARHSTKYSKSKPSDVKQNWGNSYWEVWQIFDVIHRETPDKKIDKIRSKTSEKNSPWHIRKFIEMVQCYRESLDVQKHWEKLTWERCPKNVKIHREAPYKFSERRLLITCISETYLVAFSHSRKAPISFVISFRLYVRIYRLRFRRTGFYVPDIAEFYKNMWRRSKSCLKSDTNTRHLH